jgi:RimJ/RimL family protein N-acetyltransferase
VSTVFLAADRVTLHPPSVEDADFVQRVSLDEQVWRTGFTPFPRDREAVASFLREEANSEDRVDFLVRVQATENSSEDQTADRGERAGMVSLTEVDYRRRTAELSYWLAPAFHGEGYATEAAGRVVEYAVETLGLHRIEANVDARNDPSVGLLESLGFTHEGTRREVRRLDGERSDMHVYGLLAPEW